MLDHNRPASQFPAARKILQFALPAKTVQVLILSYSSQLLSTFQILLTKCQHRLGSQLIKKILLRIIESLRLEMTSKTFQSNRITEW